MTITHRATVDVFLQAFHSLRKSQRQAFLDELFREQRARKDLLDVVDADALRRAIRSSRGTISRAKLLQQLKLKKR